MLEAMKKYQRISFHEREELSLCLAKGDSLHNIASKLGRSAGSLSREFARAKKIHPQGYYPTLGPVAAEAAKKRSRTKKLDQDHALRNLVFTKLRLGWSPEQIANRLKLEYGGAVVSHETIYTYLYLLPKGQLRAELTSYLRKHRP
jgi:transposase, IS30 family